MEKHAAVMGRFELDSKGRLIFDNFQKKSLLFPLKKPYQCEAC